MSRYALKDSSHPANHLLQLLPSGKHTEPLKQAPHYFFMLFVSPQSFTQTEQ